MRDKVLAAAAMMISLGGFLIRLALRTLRQPRLLQLKLRPLSLPLLRWRSPPKPR